DLPVGNAAVGLAERRSRRRRRHDEPAVESRRRSEHQQSIVLERAGRRSEFLVQSAGVRAAGAGDVRERRTQSGARSPPAELGLRAVQDVRSAERHACAVPRRGVQLPELSESQSHHLADESDQRIVRTGDEQDERTQHSAQFEAALLKAVAGGWLLGLLADNQQPATEVSVLGSKSTEARATGIL